MSRVAVPVLTWHSMNVGGLDYAANDHVALREDLETLHRLGVRVVPLARIARAVVEGRLEELAGCVGLSLDDGADFDFHDMPHEAWGPQRGMARILEDFRARHGAGAQPQLHATSFVIASPEARVELDRTCMTGCRWWNDDWWRQAEARGLLAVESHGWDHNHVGLERTAASAPRGSFAIDNRADADAQVAKASRYITERRGRAGDVLFAYPYGDASAYLADEYLPDSGAGHGVYAAFTCDPRPVEASSPRWRLPRYVCGAHWHDPGELERVLADAGIAPRAPLPDAPAGPSPHGPWRDYLRTWEVADARVIAGDLFRRSFGHDVPEYGRHFVLVYSPPPGDADTAPRVVAYIHHTPLDTVHLAGGMCVDAAAYRRFPRWLFDAVREEGGLATLVSRDTFAVLGGDAVFGHVGEPRARAADLRAGYRDTGRPSLMVCWLRDLPDPVKQRLVDRVEAQGPF